MMIAALVFGALALGLQPDPEITVSEWAATERIVAPEASRYHGRWDNALVPYLVEIMDELSLCRPSRDVVLAKSAQIAGTEAGINTFGTIASRTPAPGMTILPTGETVKKYVRTKLEPAIDVTPILRRSVFEQKSRDEKGSTSTFKKFPGGWWIFTGANSSADLQMVSVRVLILEEVSEYPFDVDGRGDPVDLALARTKAYSDVRKVFWNSTPGIKGMCRITKKFEESDQRRFYVPCPQCGAFHTLKFDNLRWDIDGQNIAAYFVCPASGCIIGPEHRARMVARGVWLKTYPGDDAPGDIVPPDQIDQHRARASRGRQPGFHIWQAYSPFVSWRDTVDEYLRAKGDPFREKVFTQQALGEAYEAKGESPDYLKIFARREPYMPAVLPPGALILTGAADVQADRIEWAVWAWGIGKSSWLIDKGVIAGDTADLATFHRLNGIVAREYENHAGRKFPVEGFAIDSGFNTHTVYAWVRTQGPRVIAVKGMPGHLRPGLGTPEKQDVNYRGQRLKGGVLLWPVGTWMLKAEFYANLRKTIAGPDADGNFAPGYVHLPADGVDESYIRQLTAEYLVTRERKGFAVSEWVKPSDARNEALDIRVYAAAAAIHIGIDRLTPAKWLDLAAARGAPPERSQMELALWQGLIAQRQVDDAAPPPKPAEVAEALAAARIIAPQEETKRPTNPVTQAVGAPRRSPWIGSVGGWHKRR